MPLLERFLSPESVSLKICGVTLRDDAEQLVTLGVAALGVNFWPQSQRFIAPENAAWLHELAGKILRVGVFVNASATAVLQLVDRGLLDVVQLHGDETPAQTTIYQNAGIPIFKAFRVSTPADLEHAADFGAHAILLDAHAPGSYGGTGTSQEPPTGHLPRLRLGWGGLFGVVHNQVWFTASSPGGIGCARIGWPRAGLSP